MLQRSRDLVSGQLTLDYFMRKAAEGWTLAAVEWIRETEDRASDAQPMEARVEGEETPYGVRVARDGLHLEENPLETTVLLLILEKIVKEKRITEIARDLNQEGFKTRRGMPWSPSAVFDLLPRLIEVGPKLLKTTEWPERRAGRSMPN
jgi:hypothetical protein